MQNKKKNINNLKKTTSDGFNVLWFIECVISCEQVKLSEKPSNWDQIFNLWSFESLWDAEVDSFFRYVKGKLILLMARFQSLFVLVWKST